MKTDKIRTCLVCGKQYEYCPHCSKYNSFETWRMIYCSEGHKEIFHIFDKYRANKISAEDAYKELVKYNIKDVNLTELVKPVIDEIIKTGRSKNKRKSAKAEKIVKND